MCANTHIKNMGRPSKYSKKLAKEICEHVAAGGYIEDFNKMEGMPCSVTVYHWVNTKPEFSKGFTSARRIRAHHLAHRAIAEACDDSKDVFTTDETYVTKTGETKSKTVHRVSHANVARSKLKIETYLRLAAIDNSDYSERTRQEITGANGAAIAVQATPKLAPLTAQEWIKLVEEEQQKKAIEND